jgi:hypothetical protein
MKSTINTTNRIQAICVAAPAKPEKPRIAAMSPMTKNVMDQLNICVPPFFSDFVCFKLVKQKGQQACQRQRWR